MGGKAQRVALPVQTHLQKFRGYWTKGHQTFIRRRGGGGINACIRIAILLSVVECQRPE